MRGAAAGTRGNGDWEGTSRGQGEKNGSQEGAAEGFETRYIYVFLIVRKMFQPFSGPLFFAGYQRGSG